MSSPSSPEFLLPAFESSLQLSSSPTLGHVQDGCLDSNAEDQVLSGRPAGSRLRRFSRSHSAKKLTHSPSRVAVQADGQAPLDATDVRKFKKAGKLYLDFIRPSYAKLTCAIPNVEQRLTQSAHYLSKKHSAKAASSPYRASIITDNDIAERTSQPASTPTSPRSTPTDVMTPTSPNTTPTRRSRLARAFASSPVISPNLSPSSPRTAQSTPRSRNGRRWSQALHAIMSPSPSLPQTASPSLASVSDITWAEATNSSPNVSSTEVSRWEMTIAIESTRSAQSQLLKTIRELVAKLDKTMLEQVPEMKEYVVTSSVFSVSC